MILLISSIYSLILNLYLFSLSFLIIEKKPTHEFDSYYNALIKI